MTDLPVIIPGELVLLCAPADELLNAITAKLALAGPVCVLDAGNQFDAYAVARLVRHPRDQLPKILHHIRVARGFTCYQVVALFEQATYPAIPYVVFDLLATFSDENVPLHESYRLLRIVVDHLHRLRRAAPVVVSVQPPRKERAGLLKMVADAADRVFIWEAAPAATQANLL